MSNPALARNDDDGDRFYTFGAPPERFWSVTTIIGGGVPKYLHPWYAKMAAELAYETVAAKGPHARARALLRRWALLGRADFMARQARGELTSLKLAKQSERDLALRWLKGAAERSRDESAARGTAVHEKAEDLALDHAREATRLTLEGVAVKPWPEPLAGYERSFRAWIGDWHPIVLATEATVINRTMGYAGTLDTAVVLRAGDIKSALARAHTFQVPEALMQAHTDQPITVCTDYKSGNRVYAEVALQLAALSHAEFVAHPLGRLELPMPHFDLGAVLHLTPTGYDFKLVRIDQPIFDAFLYAAQVYRFRKETAATVFIADLKPVPVEAVA